MIEEFASHAQDSLARSLEDKAFLHGLRVEKMFEVLVVSLDNFRLFKTEDVGEVHGEDLSRAPDFRLVLKDGEQLLIEVKNVYVENPSKQRKHFSPEYIKSLLDYSDLMKCSLKVAIFWARWGFWTLVDVKTFQLPDGSVDIKMPDAMKANEMSKLGDIMVGTKAPLRLVLKADLNKPRILHPNDKTEFTIGGVSLFSEEVELDDPIEQQIVWMMMNYGSWEMNGPYPIMNGDSLEGIELIFAPQSLTNQGFEMVGYLSTFFSRYYSEITIKNAEVVQLEGDPVPEWFRPIQKFDHKSAKLPLWNFIHKAS